MENSGTETISICGYNLNVSTIKKALFSIDDLNHQIKQFSIRSLPLKKHREQLCIYIEVCSKHLSESLNENQLVYEFIHALKKEGQYYREFFKNLDQELFPEIKLIYKPISSL
ncbi:MAG: hypothetical protein ACK50A_00280 [Sphingobacteriaceae bacterium]